LCSWWQPHRWAGGVAGRASSCSDATSSGSYMDAGLAWRMQAKPRPACTGRRAPWPRSKRLSVTIQFRLVAGRVSCRPRKCMLYVRTAVRPDSGPSVPRRPANIRRRESHDDQTTYHPGCWCRLLVMAPREWSQSRTGPKGPRRGRREVVRLVNSAVRQA